MRHVGLDLSLTSTGACVLDPGEAPRLIALKSKPKAGGSLRDRRDRLVELIDSIEAFLDDADGELAIRVEAPTYATNSGHQHDRSGLWWLVVEHFIRLDVVIGEVSPTTVKAFATGTGSASKTMMAAVTAREFPGLPLADFREDDKPDALWLALLSEYLENPDAGRVERTKYRDKAASAVPRH